MLLTPLPACANQWDGRSFLNADCSADINMLLCGVYNFITAFVFFYLCLSNKSSCSISDIFNINTTNITVILSHKQNMDSHYITQEVQIKQQ